MTAMLTCLLHTAFVAYSEFDDELLEEKGDEWLPLGPSFQKHVSCYVM